MRLTDWFLVIPFLPLAIVLASVLGRVAVEHHLRDRDHVVAGDGARCSGAQVLSVKERMYVERARALGAGQVASS